MIRLLFVAMLPLAGCADFVPQTEEKPQARLVKSAPPGAAPGTCWGYKVVPAVIETTKEDVLVRPGLVPQGGLLQHTAIYQTTQQKKIVTPRQDIWFEVPCQDKLTPEFISSLQRALTARGYYKGAISGRLDRRTRRAVRAFQAPSGLDSDILSVETARKLGLIAVKRDTSA